MALFLLTWNGRCLRRVFLHVRVRAAQTLGGTNELREKSRDSRAVVRRNIAGNGAKRSCNWRPAPYRCTSGTRTARTGRDPARRAPTASRHAKHQCPVGDSRTWRPTNPYCASRAPRAHIHAGTAHHSGLHRGYAGRCDMRLRYGS